MLLFSSRSIISRFCSSNVYMACCSPIVSMVSRMRFRGGPRIFSQGGSGGKQSHKEAAGVSGEGMEGGLGLPQENFEYEVLQERF